jgi:hypothetical protein
MGRGLDDVQEPGIVSHGGGQTQGIELAGDEGLEVIGDEGLAKGTEAV